MKCILLSPCATTMFGLQRKDVHENVNKQTRLLQYSQAVFKI